MTPTVMLREVVQAGSIGFAMLLTLVATSPARAQGTLTFTVNTSAVLLPGVITAEPISCVRNVDQDLDGLDDGEESCWLGTYAPVMYLPLSKDWTLPASVDWYLRRTTLRFHHNNCSDDQILGLGAVTQSALSAQSHRRKKGVASWNPCSHYGTAISAASGPWDDDQHFFLQPPNDGTHQGSLDPKDWIVYGHVYPNDVGGVNLQYWFFYAYNDNVSSFNHEADWESIIVELGASHTALGVYFCGHGDCSWRRSTANVQWFDRTHPKVWVADGSHASYPGEWECDNAPVWEDGVGDNCETNDTYRWFPWLGAAGPGIQGGGFVNVGERGHPLNGQRFIEYYGQWGENGASDTTSGPRTPSFQSSWNFRRR